MRFVATALFVAVLLCTTSAVTAGVPSPANSTVPACLVVCPAGDVDFVVVVRDVANNTIVGSMVMLDFSACPEFHVCPDCCPNVAIDWQARTARTYTDATGAAHFPLKMGGVCTGGTVLVSADGIWFGHRPLASPDQDDDLDVDASDAAHVNGLIGSHDAGADFDCDGTVTQADFDWLANGHGGHSCAGIVPTRASTWGSIKVIYR